jgi:methionyl-tRNA formyltransferase
MKYVENKILFLGNDASPLLKWLKSVEVFVLQTSEKITTELIHSNNINFIVSYGYHHILGNDILDLLPDRAINLHISYLPFNRGADPNLWSFVENTPKGVTIHYLDVGIDTGDIIVQEELQFDSNFDTLASTYEKLQVTIVDLFKENWQDIKTLRCKRKKQHGEGTFHKVEDKKKLDDLLEDGWDTKIFSLNGQVLDK